MSSLYISPPFLLPHNWYLVLYWLSDPTHHTHAPIQPSPSSLLTQAGNPSKSNNVAEKKNCLPFQTPPTHSAIRVVFRWVICLFLWSVLIVVLLFNYTVRTLVYLLPIQGSTLLPKRAITQSFTALHTLQCVGCPVNCLFTSNSSNILCVVDMLGGVMWLLTI